MTRRLLHALGAGVGRIFYSGTTAKTTRLSDAELVVLIEDIQDELTCYGYRRVSHELSRRGHPVNHKRVSPCDEGSGLGNQAAEALCTHDL